MLELLENVPKKVPKMRSKKGIPGHILRFCAQACPRVAPRWPKGLQCCAQKCPRGTDLVPKVFKMSSKKGVAGHILRFCAQACPRVAPRWAKGLQCCAQRCPRGTDLVPKVLQKFWVHIKILRPQGTSVESLEKVTSFRLGGKTYSGTSLRKAPHQSSQDPHFGTSGRPSGVIWNPIGYLLF